MRVKRVFLFVGVHQVIFFSIHLQEVLETLKSSKASDVWSFGKSMKLMTQTGVVMYEIFEISTPFYAITSNAQVVIQVCQNNLRLERPSRIEVPDKLWVLMRSCWAKIPSERPSFQEIYGKLDRIQGTLNTETPKEEAISQSGAMPNSETDHYHTKSDVDHYNS